MKAIKEMKKNEHAVSPIVATLVLIVVAVVGAVAVGTIMGTFSGDVSKQANAGDAKGAASTEVLVVGSTTVLPASELIAKAYMTEHPGIKISVQGGGSGAGVASVGKDIVDIGASSSPLKPEQLTTYPDLKEYLIGGSAVIVVTNAASPLPAGLTKAQLKSAYENVNATGFVNYNAGTFSGTYTTGDTVFKVYQRQETSGTEETFARYIAYPDSSAAALPDACNAIQLKGNQIIADTIAGTTGNGVAAPAALGFIDWGYYHAQPTKFNAIVLDGGSPVTEAVVKAAVKNTIAGGTPTTFPKGLCRGLYYVTNGEPNPIVKNFIQFASSPAGSELVDKAGMFGNAALA